MAINVGLLDAEKLSKLLACTEEEAELLLKGSAHILINAIKLAKAGKHDQGDTLETFELQSNAAAISGSSEKMECAETSQFNPIPSTSYANSVQKSTIAHKESETGTPISDLLSVGSPEENPCTTADLNLTESEYPLDELCVEIYPEEIVDDSSEVGSWLPLSRNVFEEQPYRKKVAKYSRGQQNKPFPLSPCTVIKNKMKDRVNLLLWNSYHLNQDEIFLLNIMYPDGMVLPIRISSVSTIGQLIAYIEKTEPMLQYDTYEVVTYNPDQNLSNMPRTLTIRAAGLQHKMVIFVVFM